MLEICIKPVIKHGNNTHAWEQVCSIREYIYKKKPIIKLILINGKTQQQAEGVMYLMLKKYFNEFIGHELPTLEKDRHLFAFKKWKLHYKI